MVSLQLQAETTGNLQNALPRANKIIIAYEIAESGDFRCCEHLRQVRLCVQNEIGGLTIVVR
jgi:hypothetical protein